jgi:hypothetical protein
MLAANLLAESCSPCIVRYSLKCLEGVFSERWASGRAIGSVGMLTFLSAAIVAVFLSGAERE